MTLADCGDVLTLNELLDVLKIKKSTFYVRKAHGVWPIPPLEGIGGGRTRSKLLFSKVSVQRYLESVTPRRLPPVGLRSQHPRLDQQVDKFLNGQR